jgi:ATP-binding cassette subfamily B protein
MSLGTFPFFKQLDAMDCGPACLKIICKYYGKNFSMKYLREKCNIAREGVSLKDIGRVADEIGLRSLPLKLTLEDLISKVQLPCVLHWKYTHFVVLYKIRRGVFYLSDPQIGLVKYTSTEFKKFWAGHNEKGVALVMEPSPKLFLQKDVKVYIAIQKLSFSGPDRDDYRNRYQPCVSVYYAVNCRYRNRN